MHTQTSIQPENPCVVTFSDDCYPIRRAVGIAPLGYKKAFIDGEVVVVPDEEIADKVILAFELAARGKSFRKILKTLKAEGLQSSRGNGLALSSLHNMLTNPFYIGDYRTAKNTWHGNHAPLVSKTLFRRVQRTLKTKVKA